MYETGLGIAFLLWAASMVHLLVMINSTMERNLNKVGLRLSWASLKPRQMDELDLARTWLHKVLIFTFIAAIGLVCVLLSWLYVAWIIGQFMYMRFKDNGAPQSVKEYRWKLKNCDLSFDQIVREGMKLEEQDPDLFEETRNNMIQEMQDRGLRVG
jgi:hypothetical protein